MFLIFIYCGSKTETEPFETEPRFFETETDPTVRLRLRFSILKTEHLRFRLRFYPKTAPIRTVLSPSDHRDELTALLYSDPIQCNFFYKILPPSQIR